MSFRAESWALNFQAFEVRRDIVQGEHKCGSGRVHRKLWDQVEYVVKFSYAAGLLTQI